MEARRGISAESARNWGLLVLALGVFLLHCDPFTCFSFLSSPPPAPSFEDSTLSTATTLESIPSSTGEPKCQRPRTLTRQQSLQQPLSQHQRGRQPSQPTTSQSLGQLQAHTASVPGPNPRAHGRGQARQGSSAGSKYRPAGGRSRSNPGSWDHVVGQIRNRGLDMKSFLLWGLFSTPRSFLGALYMEQETSTLSLGEEKGRRKGKAKVKAQLTGKM